MESSPGSVTDQEGGPGEKSDAHYDKYTLLISVENRPEKMPLLFLPGQVLKEENPWNNLKCKMLQVVPIKKTYHKIRF